MSGGNRFRYGVVLGVALILAACNRPDLVDPTATPTPRLLSLEEIQTAVAATLAFEGKMTAAARPSDTPAPDKPSATPASLSSPAPALTPTHTPTSSPTAKPTLAPPTNTLPPPPSATPKPTDKPTSAPPTNTPCPDLKSATLGANAKVNSKGKWEVNLAWGSAGGCGQITGTITATFSDQRTPYVTYSVKSGTGKMIDFPPQRSEGTYSIEYILKLEDSTGQTIGAAAKVSVYWIG